MQNGWVSRPGRPNPESGSYLRAPAGQWTPAAFTAQQAAGTEPILVLDRDAITPWGWEHGSFRGSCARLAQKYPNARCIEAGNEPDGTGDASSGQSKQNYYALIAAARAAWPNAKIIAGGLVFIDFSYLDGVRAAGADVAAIHPYAQDGDSLPALIAACRDHTTLDLWCTEWGTDAIPDPHERAVWATGMEIAMWEQGVKVAICYRYDSDGSAFEVRGTEMEAAIIDAIPNVASDPPAVTENTVPPEGIAVPWDSVELITAGYSTAAEWYAFSGVQRQLVCAVIHDMEGYEAGAIATWDTGVAGAHLSILRDGHKVLNVRVEDVAWHAGTDRTTGRTPFWQAHNINPYSLGIELEGFAGKPYTPEQAVALGEVAQWLAAEHGVARAFTGDSLTGWHRHSEISNQRSDPGPTFDESWVTG